MSPRCVSPRACLRWLRSSGTSSRGGLISTRSTPSHDRLLAEGGGADAAGRPLVGTVLVARADARRRCRPRGRSGFSWAPAQGRAVGVRRSLAGHRWMLATPGALTSNRGPFTVLVPFLFSAVLLGLGACAGAVSGVLIHWVCPSFRRLPMTPALRTLHAGSSRLGVPDGTRAVRATPFPGSRCAVQFHRGRLVDHGHLRVVGAEARQRCCRAVFSAGSGPLAQAALAVIM